MQQQMEGHSLTTQSKDSASTVPSQSLNVYYPSVDSSPSPPPDDQRSPCDASEPRPFETDTVLIDVQDITERDILIKDKCLVAAKSPGKSSAENDESDVDAFSWR